MFTCCLLSLVFNVLSVMFDQAAYQCTQACMHDCVIIHTQHACLHGILYIAHVLVRTSLAENKTHISHYCVCACMIQLVLRRL